MRSLTFHTLLNILSSSHLLHASSTTHQANPANTPHPSTVPNNIPYPGPTNDSPNPSAASTAAATPHGSTANGVDFAAPSSGSNTAVGGGGSGAPTNSTPNQEYSFTYPGFAAGASIQVSSKDTIVASWVAVPPEHPPQLRIQCWDRNTTTSTTYLLHSIAFNATLVPVAKPMESSYPIPLAPYAAYSLCQLLLQDFNTTDLNGGSAMANSSVFVISDTNASAPQTWSVTSLAPVMMGDVRQSGADRTWEGRRVELIVGVALGVVGLGVFLGYGL